MMQSKDLDQMAADLVSLSSGFGQAAMTVAVLGLAIVSLLAQVRKDGWIPPNNFRGLTIGTISAALVTVALWCILSLFASIFDQTDYPWILSMATVVVILQSLCTTFFSLLLGILTYRTLGKIT